MNYTKPSSSSLYLKSDRDSQKRYNNGKVFYIVSSSMVRRPASKLILVTFFKLL